MDDAADQILVIFACPFSESIYPLVAVADHRLPVALEPAPEPRSPARADHCRACQRSLDTAGLASQMMKQASMPPTILILKVFVQRLRRKLGDDARQPRYIKTEWSIGYRFLLPGTGPEL